MICCSEAWAHKRMKTILTSGLHPDSEAGVAGVGTVGFVGWNMILVDVIKHFDSKFSWSDLSAAVPESLITPPADSPVWLFFNLADAGKCLIWKSVL